MRTATAGFLVLIAMMLMLLIAGVASAQQQTASKVWTDDDLKVRIRITQHRHVTESEMAGIVARQFVAPPTYPPGPVSVGTTWTPDDDRPDRGRPPVWFDYSWRPQYYAVQPLWPSVWYPQPVYIPNGPSWQTGPYIYRQPHRTRR